MIEQELADTNESLSDQTCTNQAICGANMKCEQEMSAMSHDLDEMVAEAGMSEEKAQRAMVDAARLADELRQEQELAMNLERDKKLLEVQVKDAQSRFALFPHCQRTHLLDYVCECSIHVLRHASVSSTYPCQSGRWLVGPSYF